MIFYQTFHSVTNVFTLFVGIKSTVAIDFSVVEEINDLDGANVFPRTFQDTFGFGLPVTRHTTVKFSLPTFVDCTIGVSENDIGSINEYEVC